MIFSLLMQASPFLGENAVMGDMVVPWVTDAVNSAGSQFFIMVEDAPHLDNQYAAFGRVITGMDVCDRIVATRTNFRDMPLKPQVMKSVTVETFGESFDEPEKV